jgi:hypothetical protein
MNTAESGFRPAAVMHSGFRRNDGSGLASTCWKGTGANLVEVQFSTRDAARRWMLKRVQHDGARRLANLDAEPGSG